MMSLATNANAQMDLITCRPSIPMRRRKPTSAAVLATTKFLSSNQYNQCLSHTNFFESKSFSFRSTVLTRVIGDDNGDTQSAAPGVENVNSSSSSFGDSYVPLFIRMLGLDYDPLDREQAVVALWKYSLGGKKCVANIMQFSGCINLILNLLNSKSSSACEAAAGLLQSISSVDLYREAVTESGAIEEVNGLLGRSSMTSEVKEQCLCILLNLSVDEKVRVKIANSDLLPILVKCLDDEDKSVQEAAGGVLANMALTSSSHDVMVEADVIPKLAKFLKPDIEGSKVIRKAARNTLLELAKVEYYRILVIEEGLVPVPMIGAATYKSFRPGLHSWPTLPDGSEIEQTKKTPSKFGASELLLGLHVNDDNTTIEEAKANAIVGRTHQQFLARIGAIELEEGKKPEYGSPPDRPLTLLPWIDGVARLVLILELEDESAIVKAVEAIADASINEHMRNSFKEAGAIKHLIRLLHRDNDALKSALVHALDCLSTSNAVCQLMEAEDVMHPLFNILKCSKSSENLVEKTVTILSRILDPSKEMKAKFYAGPVNGSRKVTDIEQDWDASAEFTAVMGKRPSIKTSTSNEVLDAAIIARLVETLKNSSANLQRKVVSILEFVTIIDPSMDTIISTDIGSALDAVLNQKVLIETESEIEGEQQDLLVLEETGLAISAASRLLSKLLESEKFRSTIESTRLTNLLRQILKSKIPLRNKDWVAACLVKLTSLSEPSPNVENPINIEVTLYETIPRLIQDIESSISVEAQESAVVELNRIISDGVVDSTQAVALNGGIFPLVKLIEEGSERAIEASLSILYNLSMDVDNHSAIIAAGVVPALRRIVILQKPQWTLALRLLRSLPT